MISPPVLVRHALILICLWIPFSSSSGQSDFCRIDAFEGVSSVLQSSTVPKALHCRCGTTPAFVRNHDGSFEAAIMWQNGGVEGEQAGAIAEPFETPGGEPGSICFMLIRAFSTTDDSAGVDLIVWDDDDGQPGQILRTVPIDLTNVAPWPLGTQRTTDLDVESTIVAVEGKFWAGVRASSPADSCSILLGADLGGGGAMTYVAAGQGLPEGWQRIESVYGQDLSLAIGLLIGDCVNPTLETSWGQIKALYH